MQKRIGCAQCAQFCGRCRELRYRSTVSISNLLDYVNEYFPDILPEDLLRHYGYTERSEGQLGRSALFQIKNTEAVSARSRLATALMSAADTETDKKALEHYQKYVKVGKITENSPLNLVGMPDGNLYFDVSKIKNEMTTHGDHLSVETLKGILALLANPIVIVEYKPGQGMNTVNAYGNLYANGKLVAVGVVAALGNGGSIISKIRTVHARNNFKTQISDGSILYLNENKKETDKWFQAEGQHVPMGGTKYGLIRSITVSFDNVKQENEKRVQEWLNVNRLQLPLRSPNLNSTNSIPNSAETVKDQSKDRFQSKAGEHDYHTLLFVPLSIHLAMI